MQRLNPNYLVVTALVSAFLGFLDATYLTVTHYFNMQPPCSFYDGCRNVLTSPYAQVGGLPVAAIGMLYYLSLACLLLLHVDRGGKPSLKAASLIAVGGVLASVWFVYLQIFVLASLCPYCIGSAAATALACACTCLACVSQHEGSQKVERQGR